MSNELEKACIAYTRITELLADNANKRRQLQESKNEQVGIIKDLMDGIGATHVIVNGKKYCVKSITKKISPPATEKKEMLKRFLYEFGVSYDEYCKAIDDQKTQIRDRALVVKK